MALSEQEQKRLDQLEASPLADDPKFADTLRETPQFRVQRRRVTLAGVVFVAGLTALVPGVQFQPVISVIGLVMMLASAITGISAWSRAEAREEPTRSSSKSNHPSFGTDFMNKLEERWRERQQGGDLRIMADTRLSPSPGLTVIRYRLGNSLELVLLPDPTASAVAVSLNFQVDSVDELPGRTGFARLFEHLMFQGSARVAPGEYMSVIEATGGNVNAFTSTNRTVYHECASTGALEIVLWLETDRLRSLAVTQENLDAQCDVVTQEKRQRYDNRPYRDLLAGLVGQHFGPRHPYGYLPIGSMKDLATASLADVMAFHPRWYRPSHAKLVICGSLDSDETIDLVERYFGDPEDLFPPPRGTITESLLPDGITTLTSDVPHPLLHCSWQAPAADDPDLLALELGLSALSDGHASRLHRRLVRERGTAHEVHDALLGHLRSPSIVSLSARPADGMDTQELAEAILEKLAILDTPSEQELERAKAQYGRGWLLELAIVEDRAEVVADTWTTLGDPALIDHRLTDLAAMTPGEVSRMLANRSAPGQLHYLPKVIS